MIELNKIHLGDNREILKSLPSESIHTCVTSPPYFGLRDYGMEDQIGLEATPEAFVQELVVLFREVKRVLRKDGTLWLNLGDSYAGGGFGGHSDNKAAKGVAGRAYNKPQGLKAKDLIGIPWRVAFALQADGWYLRQDIIWHKPNPMPESVTDRCTKSHEYIFLLSKSDRYYFNSEAIKEPVAESTKSRLSQDVESQAGSDRVPGKLNGMMKAVGATDKRNKRSVWTVTTKPFKGAHFATYPQALITPCILAGCPEDGFVLDPFMGAGTTAVAALKHNRSYVGCELNPEYLAIAEQRIKDADRAKKEQEAQLNLFKAIA
jgi:DNA modification methylase